MPNPRPDEPTVTISKAIYDQLCEDQRFLSALRAAGVDNWEGYSEACRALGDDEEDDE